MGARTVREGKGGGDRDRKGGEGRGGDRVYKSRQSSPVAALDKAKANRCYLMC